MWEARPHLVPTSCQALFSETAFYFFLLSLSPRYVVPSRSPLDPRSHAASNNVVRLQRKFFFFFDGYDQFTPIPPSLMRRPDKVSCFTSPVETKLLPWFLSLINFVSLCAFSSRRVDPPSPLLASKATDSTTSFFNNLRSNFSYR